MDVLDNYLNYLNEQGAAGAAVKGAATFVGKSALAGAKQSLWWGVVITPALWLSWRTLNSAFGKASKKCGTFTKGPGRAVCIARERIKILQQKLAVINKVKSQCSKSKDPDFCKEKSEIEVAKIQNRIKVNQNKIKEAIGESYNINENPVAAVAGLAVMIGAGMVMDKAMSFAWRSALALVSQASRKCGIYKTGPEREICMSNFKLMSLTKQFGILNKVLSTCATQKNPEKCKEKTSEKIENLKRQIQLQKDNIIIYKKESETEKREEEFKRAQKEASKEK